MKKGQMLMIMAVLLVIIIIILMVIGFKVYFPNAKIILNEEDNIKEGSETAISNEEVKNEVEDIENKNQEFIELTKKTEENQNKEYRLKCVKNCDRGLNVYDQNSQYDKIIVEFENKNPRGCDMWCTVWNGEVILRNDNFEDKTLLNILYNKKEGYRIKSDDLIKLQLVCAEGGKDGSTYQVPGCEVVIKQIFEIEKIEY